jgi:hypothetical protein
VTNPTPRRITGRVRFLHLSPDKEDRGPAARRTAQEISPRHDSDDALALARIIDHAGMGSLASFALDVFKPLHWIGGQAIWILQPFMAALGAWNRRGAGAGGLSSDAIARLIERDGGLEDLAFHLKRLEAESSDGRGARS